ncbi:unnamed protein product [Choristocarpus tenellus]
MYGLMGLACVLGVLVIRVKYQQRIEEGEVHLTPDFKEFQGTFMRVYLVALLTEWLQSGYLFSVLREYHDEAQVVIMYLAGVMSQLAFAVVLEVAGGFIPMKFRCVACLMLQAASAGMLLHPAFGGLVTSRFLGGLAAALLHSSFESWMVGQHVSQGFPLDWFTQTFNRLSVGMSFLAVAVGPITTMAHSLGGNMGPYKLSIVIVALNTTQILLTWRRDTNKACPKCADTARLTSRAWTAVGSNRKMALVSSAQACFEATTFAFGLLWTPLLLDGVSDSPAPQSWLVELDWGIVFSQFMTCIMIGSFGYKLATSTLKVTPETMCLLACAGGSTAFIILATEPSGTNVLAALLGFEVCGGVYLNAMGVIRGKYVPQEVRGLVLGVSKLLVTTLLFTFLVYASQMRVMASLLCAGLLGGAAILVGLVKCNDSSSPPSGEDSEVLLTQQQV